MSEQYLAALDVGGTKADAVLFKTTGEIVAHIVDPGGVPFELGLERALNNCLSTAERLISYADGPVTALYGAIAAVEHYQDIFPPAFRARLPIEKIRLEGDGCALISGMLGHNDGACMICGTGSSVYMRKGDEYDHIGGGGYLIDTCGSGFCLGRLAIQAALRAHDGSEHQTLLTELLDTQAGRSMWNNLVEIHTKGRAYIASFARTVFEARRRGDKVARHIFNTCAVDLSNVIWAAYERLGGPFPIVFNGGIFANYPEYAKAVRALAPDDIEVIYSDVPPVYGAAVEAMYDIGLTCDRSFRDRFMEGYLHGERK